MPAKKDMPPEKEKTPPEGVVGRASDSLEATQPEEQPQPTKTTNDAEREETASAPMMPTAEALPRPVYQVHFMRDESLITRSGCVLAFHTFNQEGHATQIGAIRLPAMVLPALKDYLVKNYDIIKSHGVEYWKTHMNLCNNAAGYGENLTVEDFGMSLSVRTCDGSLHPTGRSEVGTWALDFPFMLSPVNYAGHMSGKANPQEAHWLYLLFGYIYLNDSKRRITTRRTQGPPSTANISNGRPGAQAEQRRYDDPPSGRRFVPQGRRDTPTPAGYNGRQQFKKPLARSTQTEGDLFPILEPQPKTPEWRKSGLMPLPDAEH